MMPDPISYQQQPQAQPYIDWRYFPRPRNVNFVGLGSDQQLLNGIGLITCITAVETTGTASMSYYLRDGTDDSGTPLALIAQLAGTGISITPCAPGVYFQRGIFAQYHSGQAAISVWYIPLLEQLP